MEAEGGILTKAMPLFLIHGDDDYLVHEEARKIISSFTFKQPSEFNLETIDGMAANQNEAATIFKQLFESLCSQSFFATEKAIWWRNTNLLSSSPTASASATVDFLKSLDDLLVKGLPTGISLVITASDIDGRKSIVKTIQKNGKVISFKMDPYKAAENQTQALNFVLKTASTLNKKIEEDAALLLVEMTSGDCRTIRSELEKLTVYVGDQTNIREEDIRVICSWRPGGVVWDLPDALGERHLGKTLDILEKLLFMGESPIGLLSTIVSRIRLLFFLNLLIEKKLLQPSPYYPSFKSQIDQLPTWVTENLPQDKKLNPLASHPFVIWKACSGATHYTGQELQSALQSLLECHELIVSSGNDPQNILKDTLVKICMKP